MRFQYTGTLSPGNVVSLRSRVEWEIESDGTFEVADEKFATLVRERTAHEPVDADGESETEGEAADLDAMDYRELQAEAAEYDDVPGNLSEDELRAALEERR